MKRKIKEVFNLLPQKTGKTYRYSDYEEMLKNTAKRPNAGAIQSRVNADGYLTDEEITAIEKSQGVILYDRKITDCNLLNDKKNSTTVSIDYYPEVFGSCGSGKFVLSEQKELIQVPKKLFSHFSPQKQYSIINAIGDSMLPYIHNKDKLIIEHWQGEQIKDNQVYVFCYKDEIFVKRLIKNIDEIIVKSDNPDPMYRPRYIEKEDMNNVIIVGEIVGLMRDMR